jgi:hypothetical protein
MHKKLLVSVLALTGMVAGAAQALTFDKPIHSTIDVTENRPGLASPVTYTKSVYLMNIKLTPEERVQLLSYDPNKKSTRVTDEISQSLPSKAILNIENTPVLDQGKHGTCVTFATTAAIDAVLNRGDHISQTCNLTLGNYLADKGVDLPSGWDGSWGYIVLNQMMSFGYITKDQQKANSCGNLADYPGTNENETGKPMTLDEFKKIHETNLADNIMWQSILNIYQRFNADPADANAYDGEKILTQVKQFLATSVAKSDKSPVGIATFGTFIPSNYCSSGACGRNKVKDDSWVLIKAMENIDPYHDQDKLGGHEMVIIGYDDNATSTDRDMKVHHGLLILRNSWGEKAGDHGNYYMSYDFFKKFAIEVQFIYHPNLPQ